jgi:hypothetical protein
MAFSYHPFSSGDLKISQDCEIVVIRVGIALTKGDEQVEGSDIVNTRNTILNATPKWSNASFNLQARRPP